MAGDPAREEEGKKGRPDQKLTGNPPGRSPWPEVGRRMAGDNEFRRRRSLFPARYPRRWRRFRSPRLDSLNGEVEDGDGDLLSTSEERGGARNGGARRRAPATVSHERERVTNGEEREGRPGDRKKGRRGRRGIQVQAPGVLLVGQGSRRWRWGHLGAPRSSSLNSTMKTKQRLQKSP
jgi:hypothetical protein